MFFFQRRQINRVIARLTGDPDTQRLLARVRGNNPNCNVEIIGRRWRRCHAHGGGGRRRWGWLVRFRVSTESTIPGFSAPCKSRINYFLGCPKCGASWMVMW